MPSTRSANSVRPGQVVAFAILCLFAIVAAYAQPNEQTVRECLELIQRAQKDPSKMTAQELEQAKRCINLMKTEKPVRIFKD